MGYKTNILFIIFCITQTHAKAHDLNLPNDIVDLNFSSIISENSEPTIDLEEDKNLLLYQNLDREWAAPNYSSQENALGYDNISFNIPPGLEDRVNFWKEIYTKYTTSQGVIHDTKFLSIVYESIDFNEINNNLSLNSFQKSKAREKLVKTTKEKIRSRLISLQSIKDPLNLQGDELRYWNLFQKITDKDKFGEASQKDRLRFQLGQRDKFIQGITYSGSYIREMEEIFRKEGLPLELTRLPFVESSFNLKAKSKVGASGIWQFMRRTGKSFLKINPAIDERNDPIMATQAAARLLRQNYQMLEVWPLAITGYNHGAYGVHRLVKQLGTTDIVNIIENGQKANFGFASQNFYACFLAALHVEKEAQLHFGKVKYGPEIKHHSLKLKKNMFYKNLLSLFEFNKEMADFYNPHLTNFVKKGMPIPVGTTLRVPSDKSVLMTKLEDTEIAESEKINSNLKSITNFKPNEKSKKETKYKVSRGDTLSEIAKNFGVTISLIQEINDLQSTRRIRAGQILVIPQKN